MPHVMELLASTDPYMPDSVIICRWLFGDWSPGEDHPASVAAACVGGCGDNTSVLPLTKMPPKEKNLWSSWII